MHRPFWMTVAVCLATSAQAAPLAVPTSLPGVVSFAGPPPGFDPVAASDADLAAYGFPPRPATVGSQARHGWEHMMSHARARIFPELRVAHRGGGPLRSRKATRNGASTSTNWSGITVTNFATSYGLGSFVLGVGEFNVPVAQQAFGVCSGGWDYSALWVGLDGVNNNDVLQAGTEADAYCSNGTTNTDYYAWVEWYPADTLEITNLAITPGDVVAVWVYPNSATTGAAFVINETTNQYLTMGITAPAGTSLQGSSVEWIMERPSNLDGSLTTLTNYVVSYMSNMYGQQAFQPSFPALSPPAFSYVGNSTMVDSLGYTLSVANTLGNSALQFQDVGNGK